MGVDNDNDFKKVTQTLCTWLRTFSGLKNLSHCINYFLDGLRVSGTTPNDGGVDLCNNAECI